MLQCRSRESGGSDQTFEVPPLSVVVAVVVVVEVVVVEASPSLSLPAPPQYTALKITTKHFMFDMLVL